MADQTNTEEFESVVYLDVTRLLLRVMQNIKPTGVDRVGLAYLVNYQSNARAILFRGNFFIALSLPDSTRVFNMILGVQPIDKLALILILMRAIFKPIKISKTTKTTIIVTGHNFIFRKLASKMKDNEIKIVFFIHDFIPITHPEYCRPKTEEKHFKGMQEAIHNVDGIIFNSYDTLNHAIRFAKTVGSVLPEYVVAHLGTKMTSDDHLYIKKIKEPYFLMLGTIESRKNHYFMFLVWRQLVEQMGDCAPKLLIIGRRGWECESAIDILDRCTFLKSHLIELSHCNDEELISYIKHAQALIFPSLVEGFGIPIVEALILNTPVIASNLAVFKEIANDIPEYISPIDGEKWVKMIKSYSTTDECSLRAEQIQRMSTFQAPSWSKHFSQVDKLIRTLHDRR